jgi:hypothetical protein
VSPAKRVWLGLLLAAALGVAAGLFKGNDPGLRGGIGNLSAPWLLVALLPALHCRSVLRGALLGFTSMLVALAGLYAALTVVLAGQLGGGGHLAELLVEVNANRIYFLGGIVTGPVLGAIGAWLGRHRPHWVWLAVGALVAGEMLVVALVHGVQLLPAPVLLQLGRRWLDPLYRRIHRRSRDRPRRLVAKALTRANPIIPSGARRLARGCPSTGMRQPLRWLSSCGPRR